MRIRELFFKPIDRDLKGVIKVGQDDEANIRQELEEYVVTRELQQHFADFFAAYKRGALGRTDKMGVWISGFFGSGKSHFLKILSYLLANREVCGKRALDYFIEDNKIEDPAVLEDMKLCTGLAPQTDVILFNVDSKSETKDAIVSVFLKVFNEMQGFIGSRPWLADFERELAEEGRYEEFKALFEACCAVPWTAARIRFSGKVQDAFVETLTQMGCMSEAAARNWCAVAREIYRISIEGFAALVRQYIERKGENHHVVFLADEIGQYIGDDSKLMLNLQTVTEDLGTACGGKAWVVVTSQQDIDTITKDMGLRSNDFSKIQGRFDTRLSLSSANVDEVIKKRVLAKTETAAQALRLLFGQKETFLKNLLVWNDGVEKKLYDGEEDFAGVYPFVPYQFHLLGEVLTSIRTHGASGKHLSEGERSMLALFKESAMRIMEEETGALIPFSLFYDALHQFLDHSHAGVIAQARNNALINPERADDCFAVEVLKTLFMIKYVSSAAATPENLASLLAPHMDADRIELKKQVDVALRVLTQQKLVQKNGELYVFLTDEEQEINREIDGQSVELAEVAARISSMVFEDIFTEKRYRYPEHGGRYTFPFSQWVDEHPHRAGQGYDIALRIITPQAERRDETAMRLRSGEGREALLVLPEDRSYIDELREALKIDKYLRMVTPGSVTKLEQIKATKGRESQQRKDAAKLYLTQAMKGADIYVNGDRAQIPAKDVPARLDDALGQLAAEVYNKLGYIDSPKSAADIARLFSERTPPARQGNEQALNDVLEYVTDNSRQHLKTSMKRLLDRFMKAPYGFTEDDVEWLAAKLFRDGSVAFTVGGQPILALNTQPEDLVRYVTRKEFAEKLMLERRERANEAQKKALREVMKELFGSAGASDDDDEMMQAFRSKAGGLLHEIKELELQGRDEAYPGGKVLKEGRTLLLRLAADQPPLSFFREAAAARDDCLDLAEDFAQVKAFFAGEQKVIFDKALRQLSIYNRSRNFFVNETVEQAAAGMQAILDQPAPYAAIPRLPELVERFIEAYDAVLNTELPAVLASIEDAKAQVLGELEPKPYRGELFVRCCDIFQQLKEKAQGCNNVADLLNIAREADALKLTHLREMERRDAQLAAQAQTPESPAAPPKPRVKRVSILSVNTGGTWQVKNEQEIDVRLAQLKGRLMRELADGDVLQVVF